MSVKSVEGLTPFQRYQLGHEALLADLRDEEGERGLDEAEAVNPFMFERHRGIARGRADHGCIEPTRTRHLRSIRGGRS